MSGKLAAIKEWINPAWGKHRTVPPMEAGLRPNALLEQATSLLPAGSAAPDDIAHLDGRLFFSSGGSVSELRDGQAVGIAKFTGTVTALSASGSLLVAAVDGQGLVEITPSGTVREISVDPAVQSCVTDIAARNDGVLLVSVGSSRHGVEDWSRSLLMGESSGSLVLVRNGEAKVEATGLAWPAGVAWDGEGAVVSLSLTHRIERRVVSNLSGKGEVIVRNMPVYPGRITAAEDGWWVAAPYTRNRFTELLLDEPEVCADMMNSIEKEQWFVPRLGQGNPWTDPLQIGQIRVLGVVKPWAPARSYGLVFHIHPSGRIVESYHSRVDGKRHGITGVTTRGAEVIVAACGAADIYELPLTRRTR